MLRALGVARLRNGTTRLGLHPLGAVAPFATSGACPLKQMPPRPKPPPEEEIQESFLRGSGPGGQKIVWFTHSSCFPAFRYPQARPDLTPMPPRQNKTSSAVQLKHVPTGIVVKSQATRSRDQNRKIARELLAARLDDMQNGDQSRSAIMAEIKKKKAASASKKTRRKYRKIEDEKAGSTTEDQAS